MSGVPARSRAVRGQGDRLRAEILDVTERLILEHGDAERVSVRAIARAAGVSPGSIYLHFPDKQELVFAVCERHFSALDRWAADAMAGLSEPLERLHAMGRAYVAFGLEHPGPYRVIFMTPASIAPERFSDERLAPMAAFGRLVDAVQACIDSGAFRSDLDAYETAVAVWSCVHGVTSLLITKPSFPWPEQEPLVEAVLTSAVAAFVAAGHRA